MLLLRRHLLPDPIGSDLDSQDSSMRKKKLALEMGHELYETRLGLKFDKTNDGSLVFKMRNIDPSFPSREFSFSIRVEEDEKYHGKEGAREGCC